MLCKDSKLFYQCIHFLTVRKTLYVSSGICLRMQTGVIRVPEDLFSSGCASLFESYGARLTGIRIFPQAKDKKYQLRL
jgi:hypothetical protein